MKDLMKLSKMMISLDIYYNSPVEEQSLLNSAHAAEATKGRGLPLIKYSPVEEQSFLNLAHAAKATIDGELVSL